jgi:hypothetical protein
MEIARGCRPLEMRRVSSLWRGRRRLDGSGVDVVDEYDGGGRALVAAATKPSIRVLAAAITMDSHS